MRRLGRPDFSTPRGRPPDAVKLLLPYLPVAIVLVVTLVFASPSHSTIHRDGAGPTGCWIFSRFGCACESAGCPIDPITSDLQVVFIFDPPLGFGLFAPWGIQPLGEVNIDSVAAAPDSEYGVSIDANANEQLQVGRTYVLRTQDGGHALIIPIWLDFLEGMIFAYKYQDDGSGLFTPIATNATTWGRIKALYSGDSRARPRAASGDSREIGDAGRHFSGAAKVWRRWMPLGTQ